MNMELFKMFGEGPYPCPLNILLRKWIFTWIQAYA